MSIERRPFRWCEDGTIRRLGVRYRLDPDLEHLVVDLRDEDVGRAVARALNDVYEDAVTYTLQFALTKVSEV